MPLPPSEVTVIGRFPPPVDGQAVATRRLANLLDDTTTVTRIDLSTGDRTLAESAVRFRMDRVAHYWRTREQVRTRLPSDRDVPVLWTSISPSVLGHARDQLTVWPHLRGRSRVFGVVHWGNFDRVFRSPLTHWTALRMVHNLHGLVFLNQMLADRCATWVPSEKRFIIPNTIDRDLYCSPEELARKQRNRRNRTTLRLLFLSNMTPSKGYLDVLDAVRLLHNRGVPMIVDFAGRWESDADAADFAERVHRAGLDEIVTHHGGVYDRARIKALHLQADIFLLPTYYSTEAQPLSIIEALNAGTPIVTTEHAGIPEMVRADREALFVFPRNPEAIADAVERLRDRTFWEMCAGHARTRFETTFHPDTVRRHWLELMTR